MLRVTPSNGFLPPCAGALPDANAIGTSSEPALACRILRRVVRDRDVFMVVSLHWVLPPLVYTGCGGLDCRHWGLPARLFGTRSAAFRSRCRGKPNMTAGR